MRSVKPGRGPSAMGAISSLAVAIFGVFWTIGAINMGAPLMFPLFGGVFVLLGLGQAYYNYTNATGKNRMSIVDIVEGNEEPDPLQRNIDRRPDDFNSAGRCEVGSGVNFCPFCGAHLQQAFQFCPSCGQKIQAS